MKANSRICLLIFSLCFSYTSVTAQEILVMSSPEEVIEWFQSKNWWGEANRAQQLAVPRAIITSTGANWRTNSRDLTVATKKEIFYRSLLPLIMHANEMVLDRRERLRLIQVQLDDGASPSPLDIDWLAEIADVLRISNSGDRGIDELAMDDLGRFVTEALYRLDVIPAGLALGQAAYESGYGTSRFAAEGNALFGQWTFGGSGLVPEKQRGELGDHRIAAFDWPFDSVRSYFINLNSHPAYEDFRRLRADLRQQGKALDSHVLADGLIRYSERGQEYVDTLKGIMRVNNLAIADAAMFRDEALIYIIGAEDESDAIRVREEIEKMRETGEIEQIIRQMALE